MASLSDIAAAAGVSAATASRALNGRGPAHRISDDTVARIVAIAKKLGYTPSYHARALRSQRAATIGVVLNSGALLGQSQGWSASILGGLDLALRGAGSNVLLIGDRDRYAVLEEAWSFLRESRVDALVIFDYVLSRYRSTKGGIPIPDSDAAAVVVIGESVGTKHARVTLDAGPGLVEAVQALHGQGHRRFAWISHGRQERSEQVERAVRAVHGQIRHIDLGPIDRQAEAQGEAAYAAMLKHRRHLDECTAVLCFNDQVAIAAMAVLRDDGREAGRDVAVVGVDDLIAATVVPGLSTVHMPLVDVGRCAAELALRLAEAPQAVAAVRGTCQILPGRFMARRSSAGAVE